MKKTTLLIALALAGCSGTKKTASEGQSRTQHQSQTHTTGSRQSRERENVTQSAADTWSEQLRRALETQTNEELRVEMKLYDTARSADSLTGRAPLLADMTLQRQRRATTRQNESAAHEGTSRDETLQSNERTDSLHEEHSAREESLSQTRLRKSEQTTRRTPWWVYALLLGVLSALVVALRRQFSGRF